MRRRTEQYFSFRFFLNSVFTTEYEQFMCKKENKNIVEQMAKKSIHEMWLHNCECAIWGFGLRPSSLAQESSGSQAKREATVCMCGAYVKQESGWKRNCKIVAIYMNEKCEPHTQ